MKQLICKILDIIPGFSSDNYVYGVFDGEELVATGISSDESLVKKDAGGYHTKKEFDEKYPEGWNVNFNF